MLAAGAGGHNGSMKDVSHETWNGGLLYMVQR